MECRISALVQSLLRLVCDLSTESIPPAVREELVTKATHCLLLLDHCTQGKLKVGIKQYHCTTQGVESAFNLQVYFLLNTTSEIQKSIRN